jgi:hypothetical protein
MAPPRAIAPPPTPEQTPPRAPIVIYVNGELTIQSDNATLLGILQMVRDKTGAELEVPASADERVFGNWGPGQVRDVLAALLNGSKFNYVMLGSLAHPNGLAQIILSPKPVESALEGAPLSQAAALPPEPVEAENVAQYAPQEEDRLTTEERMRQQRSLQLLQVLQQRQSAQRPSQ